MKEIYRSKPSLFGDAFRISVGFEPRDLWFGVYWNKPFVHPILFADAIEIFVCLIPTLPIKFEKYWRQRETQEES